MKNKRLVFVLLPAALLVWGLIVFRVWSAVESDSAVAKIPLLPVRHVASAPKVVALPKLSLQYRDPFQSDGRTLVLEAPAVTPTLRSTTEKSFTLPLPKPASSSTSANHASVVWPKIEYTGLIENQRQNKRVAMISLDGVGYLIKEGGMQGNIKVKRITTDSVQLKCLSELKTFRRTTGS